MIPLQNDCVLYMTNNNCQNIWKVYLLSISDVNETLNNTKMVIWDDVLFLCKRVGAYVVKNLF